MATPLFWMRQPDTIGVLGLALNTCDGPTNGYREQTQQIKELILAAEALYEEALALEDEREKLQVGRYAFRLIHLADILAVTSHAA
jgi:hypothetical protein